MARWSGTTSRETLTEEAQPSALKRGPATSGFTNEFGRLVLLLSGYFIEPVGVDCLRSGLGGRLGPIGAFTLWALRGSGQFPDHGGRGFAEGAEPAGGEPSGTDDELGEAAVETNSDLRRRIKRGGADGSGAVQIKPNVGGKWSHQLGIAPFADHTILLVSLPNRFF
jgi:hypothetical protein